MNLNRKKIIVFLLIMFIFAGVAGNHFAGMAQGTAKYTNDQWSTKLTKYGLTKTMFYTEGSWSKKAAVNNSECADISYGYEVKTIEWGTKYVTKYIVYKLQVEDTDTDYEASSMNNIVASIEIIESSGEDNWFSVQQDSKGSAVITIYPTSLNPDVIKKITGTAKVWQLIDNRKQQATVCYKLCKASYGLAKSVMAVASPSSTLLALCNFVYIANSTRNIVRLSSGQAVSFNAIENLPYKEYNYSKGNVARNCCYKFESENQRLLMKGDYMNLNVVLYQPSDYPKNIFGSKSTGTLRTVAVWFKYNVDGKDYSTCYVLAYK